MRSPVAAFLSAKIGTQVAVLVVAALMMAHLAIAAVILVFDRGESELAEGLLGAERLILAARMIESESEADKRAALLAAVQKADPNLLILNRAPPAENSDPSVRIVRDLQGRVGKSPELFTGVLPAGNVALLARLSDGKLLAATLPPPDPRRIFMSPLPVGTLIFLASAILMLSLWAAHQLAAPLAKFSDSAQRFSADSSGPPITESGPLELRLAARALNDMQSRVLTLMNDRARMLAAVGHDLRTPITRLRLRAESIGSPELRSQILHDLATMQKLVESALSFLRGQTGAGRPIKTDLAALVQTVCDGFSGAGSRIAYSGGTSHLYVLCEPDQLMRAVENLIGNGLKFGTSVWVRVQQCGREAVIEVEDDGPGIVDTEKSNVIKPFYRGDAARNMNEADSFGLGLSIAHSIVERSGGRLELSDRQPTGLTARILLHAVDQ